jgi:glutathione peroxidase-family protein
MHEKYNSEGLEIVAFPCNQFGRQEPGSNAEIAEFVAGYGAEFLMMDKVDVNGADASPVWSYLKGACDTCGDDVGWNFGAKFVVDKEGTVVERNGGNPSASEALIQSLL